MTEWHAGTQNLGDEWANRRKNDQRLILERLRRSGEATYAKLLENQERLHPVPTYPLRTT